MPREIEEAAVIDGAGYWRIYWSVILPLSKPILSALAILFFLANWNAFLWPLTVASDQNLWVVQVGSSTSRASIRPLGTGKPSRASKRRSGDFFGMGHARTRNYASLPMQASPEDGKAFNCYFPMPFGSGMKFTITNEAEHDLLFYYYIDLELHDELEDGLGRFHAQYRPERPESFDETGLTNEQVLFGGETVDGKGNYVILDAAGHGHYVGVLYSVYSRRRSEVWDWYGEGDDMIFVDGEAGVSDGVRKPDPRIGPKAALIEDRPESVPGANDAWPPTLHGTGTEDYFNTPWCPTQDYVAPYHGIIAAGGPNWTEPVTLYRWHVEDPVIFQKSIRVTIEHGHANRRADDISSVAFWYQAEPHRPFGDFPKVEDRVPTFRRLYQNWSAVEFQNEAMTWQRLRSATSSNATARSTSSTASRRLSRTASS